MSKIATITCIILAVSIINFEGIRASLLGKPLGSLLNNVQHVSDKLQGAITEGTETLQNVRKNVSELGAKLGADLATEEEKLRNEAKGFLKQTNLSICTNIFDEVQAIFTKLTLAFKSCLSSEIQEANAKIQRLVELVSDLQKTLIDKIQEIISHSENFIAAISNLAKELPDFVTELSPTIDEATSTALQLLLALPNVRTCFETSYFQYIQQDVRDLINDVRQCRQNFSHAFG